MKKNRISKNWINKQKRDIYVRQSQIDGFRARSAYKLIEIDDWNSPSKSLVHKEIKLEAKKLDVLHIPQGYVSCIQAIENNSKLLVMADYSIDEIKDEYRYDLNYFYN